LIGGSERIRPFAQKERGVTLDQLRIFVAVAERQHVTHAAEALNVAQSAASHAIASLEDRHKTKLFNRIGRHIELTDAGQAFLKEARAVLATVEAAELALMEFGDLKRGVLAVQASHTIANYWLPRHLAKFRRAHPQIEVRAGIGNTAQVAAAVENRETELGFVEAVIHSGQLTSRTVARDQIIVVVPLDHELLKRKRLEPADLMQVDWVLRERGSGTRAVFEEALAAFGLDARALRIALLLPSNEAVRGAVEAGLGAAVISASVAAPSLEAGLLEKIDFRLPDREFQVLTHRERHPSRAAQAFLATLTAAGTRKMHVSPEGRQF
jgi:DNA-binding transcriptional LysR family regulator